MMWDLTREKVCRVINVDEKPKKFVGGKRNRKVPFESARNFGSAFQPPEVDRLFKVAFIVRPVTNFVKYTYALLSIELNRNS